MSPAQGQGGYGIPTTATGGGYSINGGAMQSYGGGTSSTARSGRGTAYSTPTSFNPVMMSPASVSCGGAVTFGADWSGLPGEDVPENAVVVVTSIASVTEYPGSPPTSYSVDNGYQDPETLVTNSDGSKTHTSSGTHYVVKNGSVTSTNMATPVATINLDAMTVNGSPPSNRKVTAHVEIKMLFNAVTVSFDNSVSGTDGSANCLIGMTEVPKLNVQNLPFDMSNITWSATGQTFYAYDVHRDHASVTPYPAGYFTTRQIPFWPELHWSESDKNIDTVETVRCTATLSNFGNYIGQVTAKRTIHVYCPNYTFEAQVGTVRFDQMAYYAGGLYLNSSYEFVNSAAPNIKYSDCSVICVVSVRPQDIFVTNLATAGIFQFAQTITTNRIWAHSDAGAGYPMGSLHHTNNSTTPDLDEGYPYAPSAADHPPEPDDPTLGWPDDGSKKAGADGLSRGFIGPNHFSENTPFDLYLMYRAGTNALPSEIVPLHRYKWTINADFTTNPLWAGMGSVVESTNVRQKTHPTWTRAVFPTHPMPLWIP